MMVLELTEPINQKAAQLEEKINAFEECVMQQIDFFKVEEVEVVDDDVQVDDGVPTDDVLIDESTS